MEPKLLVVKVIAINIFLCSLNVQCLILIEDESYLSRAFEQIIQDFAKSNHEVRFINIDADSKTFGSIISKTAQNIPQTVTANRIHEHAIDESAVLLFKSANSLKTFNEKVIFKNVNPKVFEFVVFCKEATIEDILTIQETKLNVPVVLNNSFNPFDRTEIVHFQNFLIDEEEVLKLFTFLWYAPEHCNEQRLVEVNRFNKKTNQWQSSTFKVKKFDDFHGCKLVFGVSEQPIAFEITAAEEDGSPTYRGYNYEIINALSTNLNYTFYWNHYIVGDDIHELDYIHSNSFFFHEGTVDMMLRAGCYNAHESDNLKTFLTTPFKFEFNFIAVPPGEECDSYEKLLLPFDVEVWALIIATFVISYSVIFIINLSKPHVRNFIFGRNVTTPSLNVAAHFFGISLKVLPGRNFARFLLTTFALYCLIIRTAWQGKSFEFMQKEMRKPEVKSIDELIEKNFTFFMFDAFSYYFAEIDFVERLINILSF